MKLQGFHVEHADWARAGDREALSAIRLEVFVREQAVPESLEWDNLDSLSFHLLARDESGEPIGCARLTPHGKIGRVAVRLPWRGQGVGLGLLRALVARARSQGRADVALDAQLSAVTFYEREGFVAHGEPFEDAGILHHPMRLELATHTEPAASNPDGHALPTGNRSEIAAARLQLLTEAKHRLSIYQPALDNELYASLGEMAELRRIATSGRGAEIRILLHDPEAALRHSHRLVALAQRLPSVLHIRTPLEDVDLAYASAYLLTDQGGYLFQPDARRADARASHRDRAFQAPLAQHFNEVWERSAPARALQPLDL
ncbi:GNAT family N-acetyltransferase [Dyella jiangningensis]|uniref:GNAT family N-acetyltransferase n=1 Tax=Dyella jiangningensis TaxID=1379159 RepID=A0A328NXX5_9GAMM|nr:GNAT family N-acetyltransferase [Dyella jiangningensis]RAO75037.1 GNAT family N-acetyltransferase [Dyella jiangningensis]